MLYTILRRAGTALHLASGLHRMSCWRGRWWSDRGCILARSDIGHGGQVRDLASGGVGNVDSGVIEQQSSGAIEFDY